MVTLILLQALLGRLIPSNTRRKHATLVEFQGRFSPDHGGNTQQWRWKDLVEIFP